MEHDLAPFRGAIDDQNHVANLGGFESRACDARFLHEQIDVDESGKIETSADPSELSNLLSECLLVFDPVVVGGGGERSNEFLPEGRGGVSAQEFAQGIELEHTRRTVGEFTGHRKLMVAGAEWTDGRGEGSAGGEIQSAPAPATCAAGSVTAGIRMTKSAPPSGLFWQVMRPL